MSYEQFSTPAKNLDEKPQLATNDKGYYQQQPQFTSSKYGKNQQGEQQSPLDRIQQQIRQCAARLQEIKFEILKDQDIYSDSSLRLEDERSQLKKHIIDLDFEHKLICTEIVKKRRQKHSEEQERRKKEIEEQERRKKELDERLQKIRIEREQKQKNQEEEQKLEEEGDSPLEKSRRRLRIAEIEAQLAESKLRRSRIAILNAELDYLRSNYFYPYRSFVYPSYELYPPESYYYRSSLYPYYPPWL